MEKTTRTNKQSTRRKRFTASVGIVIAAALFISGCGGVSKDFVRGEIDAVRDDVTALSHELDKKDAKIARLEQESQQNSNQLKKALEEVREVRDEGYETLGKLTLNFAFDSSELMDKEKKKLDELIMKLDARPSAVVYVRGYADEVGTAHYNLELSQRRAATVSRYVASRTHNEATPITTLGLGELDAVADNGSKEGRAKNRRVELVVLAPESQMGSEAMTKR